MTATSKLAHNTLRISDPQASLPFYQDALGMTLIAQHQHPNTKSEHYFLGYSDAQDMLAASSTLLELVYTPGQAVRADGNTNVPDGYWKIGLMLPHVDHARRALLARGIHVSEAKQFRDIGYLCHLNDPDGHCIELLQHTFESNHTPAPPQPTLALHNPAVLGLITLRVKDPEVSMRFYTEHLGMKMLSRQIVEPYKFTLYFMAFTDDTLPIDDLDAVGNREWLWQRRYTMVELQHRWGTETRDAPYRVGPETGYLGMNIVTDALEDLVAHHASTQVHLDPQFQVKTATLQDPDGYAIRLFEPSTS